MQFVPEQAPWKTDRLPSLCIRRTCLWWMLHGCSRKDEGSRAACTCGSVIHLFRGKPGFPSRRASASKGARSFGPCFPAVLSGAREVCDLHLEKGVMGGVCPFSRCFSPLKMRCGLLCALENSAEQYYRHSAFAPASFVWKKGGGNRLSVEITSRGPSDPPFIEGQAFHFPITGPSDGIRT